MTRWMVLFALTCACGGETEGRSIEVRWTLAAAEDASDREFVTDTGWTVRLEEARLAIESVLALAPEEESASAIARVSRLLVPVARAHGGHDEASGRRIRSEWLDPFVVDVLSSERLTLGQSSAEAGRVDKIKLALARASERGSRDLHGLQAYVRGSAERDGVAVSFRGGLHFEDGEPARRVETSDRFALNDGGTLALDVHASAWFRDAEFDRLPESEAGDDAREVTSNTQVGRAWAIGVRSPAAFSVSFQRAKE